MTIPSPGADSPFERAAEAARIDVSTRHPHPSPGRFVAATFSALVASVVLDALLVEAGTRLFPSTRGYQHFGFTDYATLTLIGVLAACASWPLVTRISSAPRWLFLRMAIVITVVLWIPDLALMVRGEPPIAVGVLMVMHLAVSVVTYNCLVRMAPATVVPAKGDGHDDPELPLRLLAAGLGIVVGIESVLGIATLVSVPTGRPTGWVPPGGTAIYLAHALVGLPLVAGAVLLASRARGSSRILRLTAWIGGVGVAVAAGGGMLTVSHPLRLVGISLMLLGPIVAGFGYLLPTLDNLSEDSAPD